MAFFQIRREWHDESRRRLRYYLSADLDLVTRFWLNSLSFVTSKVLLTIAASPFFAT